MTMDVLLLVLSGSQKLETPEIR